MKKGSCVRRIVNDLFLVPHKLDGMHSTQLKLDIQLISFPNYVWETHKNLYGRSDFEPY